MKKIFVLIAFLFTVVCYAAPPPELKVYEPEKVFVALSDNYCFAVQTATVNQDFAYDAPVLSETEQITLATTGCTRLELVREVTQRPKDSDYAVENSFAVTEKYAELRGSGTTTDVEHVFQSPLFDNKRKGKLNKQSQELPSVVTDHGVITSANSFERNNKNEYHRNLQHCNYAYPFGANYNSFFSYV